MLYFLGNLFSQEPQIGKRKAYNQGTDCRRDCDLNECLFHNGSCGSNLCTIDSNDCGKNVCILDSAECNKNGFCGRKSGWCSVKGCPAKGNNDGPFGA